ncbi:MAG: HD domain-containing protein [Dehalococcoidia bacterium]|nr:HD domain-containing protein [Dehalococcoidia bacterium]
MAEKLFRDPLYDYIAIDIDKYPWLLDLINCPEVQRLRYINQLGLSHFAYPGSTHSRFSHSLGVFHVMTQCLEHLLLEKGYRNSFRPGDKDALLAAALLHDIGHGPFSHATEGFFGRDEANSVKIITSSESVVNKVLRGVNEELPAKVGALIEKGGVAPLWQKSLISGQLDMDRLDYLRRDSLCSGAEYGNFDWFRIIHTMQLKEKAIEGKQRGIFVVWPNKSKFALEEYIFSRFYMYQNVYYHHTTRGFEGLLRVILKRAQDIAKQSKSFVKALLPPMKVILGAKESGDLTKFQKLTDHVLLAQVTIWQNDNDKILSDLTERLLLRKGLGREEIIEGTPFQMSDKIEKVRKYLQSQGKDHNYYFIEDSIDSTEIAPYKPYSSASAGEEQSSVNSIMLFDPKWSRRDETGFCEITQVPGLERLQAITGAPSSILRYYFPKEYERRIKKLLS